jgi:hypothetical protein
VPNITGASGAWQTPENTQMILSASFKQKIRQSRGHCSEEPGAAPAWHSTAVSNVSNVIGSAGVSDAMGAIDSSAVFNSNGGHRWLCGVWRLHQLCGIDRCRGPDRRLGIAMVATPQTHM